MNLAPKYSIKWTHSGTWLSTFLTGTKHPVTIDHYKVVQDLKPNTEYTVVVNVKTNTQSGNINLNNYQQNACVFKDSMYIKPSDIGVKTFKVKTIESFDYISPSNMVVLRSQSAGIANGETLIEDIMILEGDHTQNPPSYFEGLMSVGQSTSEDGVDEISVLSTENLADITTSGDNANFLIANLKAGCTYSMKLKRNDSSIGYNLMVVSKSDNFIVLENLVSSCFNDFSTFTPSFDGVLKFNGYANPMTVSEIMLVSGAKTEDTMPNYKPYAPDKKRLLYYNNETQTWEKPILREWDSIEKHADGKYYYHQRSDCAFANGENGVAKFNWEQNGYTCFYISTKCKNDSDIICNLFDKIAINQIGIKKGVVYDNTSALIFSIPTSELSNGTLEGVNSFLKNNNLYVVYQLANEEVYECTNIDLITYANETNYVVNSGAIVPRTTLKVHNNISNVVSLLQKKVSLLESNITSYMITQNRLMLASRYNADTVSFKVDVATLRNSFEYDNDLYELILNNVLVGKDNYNREYIENLIIFYWMDFIISDEMHSTLFEIIEGQHNPKIEEEAPLI